MGKPRRLTASIITAYELEKGARLSNDPAKDTKLVHDLLSELAILGLDDSTVELAAELYSELSRKGKPIGEFDILISATCIASGEALVTDDRDFDRISGLNKLHY